MGRRNPNEEQLDKLKEANKKLRAQVRQLRKQLNLAIQDRELLQDIVAEDSEVLVEMPPIAKKAIKALCRKCKEASDFTVINAGIWELTKCNSCNRIIKREKKCSDG